MQVWVLFGAKGVTPLPITTVSKGPCIAPVERPVIVTHTLRVLCYGVMCTACAVVVFHLCHLFRPRFQPPME